MKLSEGERQYQKMAGQSVVVEGKTGTVCGHDEATLIVALDDDNITPGWKHISLDDVIYTCLDNDMGYKYYLGDE